MTLAIGVSNLSIFALVLLRRNGCDRASQRSIRSCKIFLLDCARVVYLGKRAFWSRAVDGDLVLLAQVFNHFTPGQNGVLLLCI